VTVVELVERERARIRALELAGGAALALVVLCGVMAAGVVLLGGARWLALPRALPFAIWTLIAAGLAAAAWVTRRRLTERTSRAGIAAAVERERALRAGALRGAIEVADRGVFGRRAAATLGEALAPHAHALAPEMRGRATRRAVQIGSAALGTALLLGVAAPLQSDGLLALLRPVAAWRGTLLAPLAFEHLPATVMRGDTLRVTIAARGRASVQLLDRTTGEGWRTRTLGVAPATGTAAVTLGPLRGDLRLVVTDGRTRTDTAVVRVADRPFVGGVTMRARYPGYLDRAPETLPVGEAVVVPRGTILEIAGRASTPLTVVGLARGRDSVALRPDGRAFSGRFAPPATATWNWFAHSGDAPVPDVPAPLDVTIVPDSAPHADILAPRADTLVASFDTVTVQGAASDDHGLAAIELHAWRAGPGGTRLATSQRLASNAGAAWAGNALVDLAGRQLRAGDVLHVTLVAVDNSPWAQRTTSRELLLEIPSLDQRRAIARAAADSAVTAVQRAATEEQSLQQRTSEAARERMNRLLDHPDAASGQQDRPRSMSYESSEKAQALAREQQDMANRVRDLQRSASRLQEQLKQAGALDSALSRQLREAQQMLHDALTPALMAEMQKLQSAARQLDAQQAEQSLAALAELQKQLRAQLEKSAQMLQRAAFEGAMQTLHDEAHDIAGRERQLADSAPPRRAAADSSGNANAGAPGARAPSRELTDRSDALARAIQQLQQKLADANASAGARNADQAHTFAAASEQTMRRSSDALAAAGEMQRAAQAMQQARDQQVAEWKNELTAELDRAVQELLQMSRQESRLEAQAGSGRAAPEQLRGDQSALQQGVEQTQRLLREQAQKTTLLSGRSQRAVSDAVDKVAQATRSAADPRDAARTPGAMGDAGDALNQAAAALARDRQRANTASSASGFAEMLRQLQDAAKRQGAINSQAQSLLPLPGQGQLAPDAQATARMLANQERRLAERLDDMSDASVGGDRAAQLAREARAVAEALQNGRVNAATVARQEQLLRHMLDAGRSLQQNQREDTGKREAEAAVHPALFTPEGKAASGASGVKYRPPTWNELRGLSADQRRAILEYFRRINGGGNS
jgi:hypothetical protein